jgi:outer membrane protein assembly factor BamB
MLLALAITAACGRLTDPRAPWTGARDHDVGRPVLGYRWQQVIVDHHSDHMPQEMATAGLSFSGATEAGEGRGAIFIGSHAGTYLAVSPRDGAILWRREIGPVSGTPLVTGDVVYIGTDDGLLYALDTATGAVKWKHEARGGILRPPVLGGDVVLFTTDNDRLIAVDRATGKFRWQYNREPPEEFTIRGHAGAAVEGQQVVTGFADGNLVAVSLGSGEILWVRSLAGETRQFVDVDTTPVISNGVVYAASAAGGVWGISASDGTERWRTRVPGTTQLVLDEGRLYVAAAESGLHALDLGGNILWRQGFARSGDPSSPLIDGTYLFLSVSESGLYVIDKRSGALLQSFSPGPGITAAPAVAHGQLYIMSNGGLLYAMNVNRF